MSDSSFVERMRKELAELVDKTDKLEKALHPENPYKLGTHELTLMSKQCDLMYEYQQILERRLECHTEKN